MSDHLASMELEHVVRRALGYEGRGALGGIADADYIDYGGAFTAIVAALAPYYVKANEQVKHEISQFIMCYKDLEGAKSSEKGERIREAAKELSSLLDKLER